MYCLILNPAGSTFIDIQAGDWFYRYVEAAAGAGLVNSYGVALNLLPVGPLKHGGLAARAL